MASVLADKLCAWLDSPSVILTVEKSADVQQLEAECEQLRAEVARLKMVARVAETRYGDEVNRCLHLQDLLRSHGINFH